MTKMPLKKKTTGNGLAHRWFIHTNPKHWLII